jgi:acetyl esterase
MNSQFVPILAAMQPITALAWDGKTTAAAARAVGFPHTMPPFEVELAAIHDIHFQSGGIPIAARLYRPITSKPLPAVAYYHGGGWVMGSIATHDFFCRQLACSAGCAVLSVEYRLAPEHRYPTAAEDCYAAVEWLQDASACFGVDPDRIAVAGDSSGGNLAAAVAILVRDRGRPPLRHQLLLYPVTDANFERPSYIDNAQGYLLTTAMMRWFWDQYLGDRQVADAQLAAVLRTKDLTAVASATVLTAEFDPLRDEGAAYARRLDDAGVCNEYVCAPGMIHGFVAMAGFVKAVEPWFDYAAARIRIALNEG